MSPSYRTKPPVVVGFGGTQAGRAAVSAAAGEAKLRETRLRIVHVVEAREEGPPEPTTPCDEVDAELAEEALDLARLTLPEDRIDIESVRGEALEELLARSSGSEILVLGRGHPNPMAVLLGPIALGAAGRALCPVLLVSAELGPAGLSGGTVVVGVDGAEDSELALDEAFAAAYLRGAQLLVIHTRSRSTCADLDADDTDALRQVVAPLRARFPRVEVTEQLMEGAAARVLVESAAQAGLLVVGTRGRGPVTGLRFGSVGQHVVAHARCPVLVARPRGPSDLRCHQEPPADAASPVTRRQMVGAGSAARRR
jgi:nucleotide-binding universal stress UspA family protein